jgi:hypothetical protein
MSEHAEVYLGFDISTSESRTVFIWRVSYPGEQPRYGVALNREDAVRKARRYAEELSKSRPSK